MFMPRIEANLRSSSLESDDHIVPVELPGFAADDESTCLKDSLV